MIRPILYVVWWTVSIALFAYTVKENGLLHAIIAWINPISPP